MRYITYLFVSLFMQIIAWLITPLLACCYEIRYGWCDNNSYQCDGPRLWKSLSWFDTPDNSLMGDKGWRETGHDGARWLDRTLWLYRNSLYGFKWTILSLPEGHPSVWQWHKKYYFQSFYLDLNFGWMLDNIENGRAMFMLSPRIKRNANDNE